MRGGLLLALALALAGCELVFRPPAPVDGGTSGTSGSSGTSGACRTDLAWPTPMPNPAGAGLPHPASHDTSTPGIVVDAVTGLAWEREVDADGGRLTLAGANNHCDALSSAELGGRHDWRLPSEVELFTLVDFKTPRPRIDPVAFPGTPDDVFWSSTAVAGPPSGQVWTIYFHLGSTSPHDSDDSSLSLARCVSGPRAPGDPGARYASCGEGVVQDLWTGLRWRQAVSAPVTWDGADTFCRNLGAGWRAPSVKELLTLVDFTVPEPGPTLDAAVFPGSPATSYWSSSLDEGVADSAWRIDFTDATVGTDVYAGPHPVRCVQ